MRFVPSSLKESCDWLAVRSYFKNCKHYVCICIHAILSHVMDGHDAGSDSKDRPVFFRDGDILMVSDFFRARVWLEQSVVRPRIAH